MKMLLSGIIKIRWSLKENPRFFTKTVTIFPTLRVVYLIKVEMNKFSEKLIFDWTVVANQGCTYLLSLEAQMLSHESNVPFIVYGYSFIPKIRPTSPCLFQS